MESRMGETNIKIESIPTNVVTGFLGAGKTSTIMNLLKDKPKTERWAVLVNEFGEIGVDGNLLAAQNHDQQVFIREVPGGCMCCAAGVPMQVALNKLLKEAKPDRLLIEPTGLGHPKEILKVLTSEHYTKVLHIQKTITLVDARQLSDSRYTSHDTFNQQVDIADIVVGNKHDLYDLDDDFKLLKFAESFAGHKHVIFSEHGKIPVDILSGDTLFNAEVVPSHHHHGHSKTLASELPMPASGMIKAENKGEGFISVGWRFSAQKIFNQDELITLITDLQVERLKAVFITDKGFIGVNMTGNEVELVSLLESHESRLEIIVRKVDQRFEPKLLACIAGV